MAISKEDMNIGDIYTSGDGKVVIIGFGGCNEVTVKFVDTGFILTSQASHVRRGALKDRLKPTVYGVGFIGDGDYKSREKGSRSVNRNYRVWSCMLSRCYNRDDQAYSSYGGDGVLVCEEWHNFQNFAKWYEQNYPKDGLTYHLDKDCLSGEFKVYSPDTCMFLSPAENAAASSAKTYKMINPDGDVVVIWNMNKFCRDNNLNVSAMSKVRCGAARHHKGWKRAE